MFKSLFAKILAMLVITSFLVACGVPQATETRPVSSINNDLAGGKALFSHPIDGEGFILHTEFGTADPISQTHITQPKLIEMCAWIELVRTVDVEVLVEHVHADAFIQSDASGWDGTKTDSMDDSIHGLGQPGFWITPEHKYCETFSVEGHNETLFKSWTTFYTSYISSSETTPAPMTEYNLIKYGKTRGQKFQVIWNLAIRNPTTETLYHTTSVVDTFAVPVDQNP